MPDEITMQFNAGAERLQGVFEALDDFAEFHGWPSKLLSTSKIAVEELVLNVAQHGSPDDRQPRVDVTIASSPQKVTILIIDDGQPFDPTTDAPPADVTSGLESRALGGLGIHLVRSLLDDVSYQWKEGRNHVLLTALRG